MNEKTHQSKRKTRKLSYTLNVIGNLIWSNKLATTAASMLQFIFKGMHFIPTNWTIEHDKWRKRLNFNRIVHCCGIQQNETTKESREEKRHQPISVAINFKHKFRMTSVTVIIDMENCA